MTKPRGGRKGPQKHAEGDHGDKTRQHLIDQLHSGPHEMPKAEIAKQKRKKAGFEGKRRLVEDRVQHDDAEVKSERVRLFVEHTRGRDDGPKNNTGKLHGVLGHREHRADYKQRGPDGLRVKE
jgi:hypothetical protein